MKIQQNNEYPESTIILNIQTVSDCTIRSIYQDSKYAMCIKILQFQNISE